MDDTLLSRHFGKHLLRDVPLASLTTSRVGGPASYLLVARDAAELAEYVTFLWEKDFPVLVLGNGSNVLVSDKGVNAVVIHNKANKVEAELDSDPPLIIAESGASLSAVARKAAAHALSGFEWAYTIPGSLGGAVYGNAGAHNGNMQGSLVLANILHRTKGYLSLTAEQMAYSYRSSLLKRDPAHAIILSAHLKVAKGDQKAIKATMDENQERRRRTQPPGSSMGSTFKNPEGDHAGRLIEAAGLKGMKIGGAQVSPVHANFLINDGTATAMDIRRLITFIQNTVRERFGVSLELEIEMIGEW